MPAENGDPPGLIPCNGKPVGHLPNEEIEMTEQEALERLAALSLLARFIDDAEIYTAES